MREMVAFGVDSRVVKVAAMGGFLPFPSFRRRIREADGRRRALHRIETESLGQTDQRDSGTHAGSG